MSWCLEIYVGKHCIRRLALDLTEVSIGRSRSCPVHLPADAVSRRHARLWVSHQVVTLEDLGSTNGIFMDGKMVSKCLLKDGDRFSIGPYLCVMRSAVLPPTFPSVSAAVLQEDSPNDKTASIDLEMVKKIHDQTNALEETQTQKTSPLQASEPVSQDLSRKFGKLR